jgi:ATP-dependent DNA helicase RecG
MTGPLAPDEFARLIASGEDSFVEFKDVRTGNRDVAKELCAFVNATGGRLLIGVDDDASLHDATEWGEERVMNIARTLLDPPIIPTYQRLQWDNDTAIVIVSVEMGAEKPYALSAGESRRYYIRVGSTSREASREELVRLTQASGAVASDFRPVLGASLGDLEFSLLVERFAGSRTINFEELEASEQKRILIEAEILHPDSGGPTIGGLLCYGTNPQAHLPFAEISCVAYPGKSPSREILDRSAARGRIAQQIETAVEFIERNLRSESTVSGLKRVESPKPTTESLREVVANAVVHRHYNIAGPSSIHVFEDRIDVRSPGEPPNGVTPGGMRVGISVRRNQFLFQHLIDQRMVDGLGRGIVLLYEEAAELGLQPPSITAADHWTTVTLSLLPT